MARPPHAMAGRPHGRPLQCVSVVGPTVQGDYGRKRLDQGPRALLRRATRPAQDFPVRAVLPRMAALRVYEPLEAFDELERTRWTAYAARSASARAAASADVRHLRLAGLAATPPIVVPAREPDEAAVLVVDDIVHICPEQSRLRAWEALAGLRE